MRFSNNPVLRFYFKIWQLLIWAKNFAEENEGLNLNKKKKINQKHFI